LVINFSSYAELSNVAQSIDLDAYAFSKKSFSHWLEKQNECKSFRLVDIMLFTIYGRFDKRHHLIPTLFESMNLRKPPRLSDGFQLINLLHVEDLTASIVRVLESSNIENGRFSLWNPEFMTLRELVSVFEKTVGMDLNPLWSSIPRKGHELDFEVSPPHPRLSFDLNPKTIGSGLETLWTEYLSNNTIFI
jgi:nucleoside-diphosphate-sugar epimerase